MSVEEGFDIADKIDSGSFPAARLGLLRLPQEERGCAKKDK
jgi:hypothetical protein